MTPDLIAAIFRTLIQMLSAAMIARGLGTEDDWNLIVGASGAVVSVAYMIWTRWNTAKVPVNDSTQVVEVKAGAVVVTQDPPPMPPVNLP